MGKELTNAYMRRWRRLQKEPAHHMGKANDILCKLESALRDADDIDLVAAMRAQLADMRKRYEQG